MPRLFAIGDIHGHRAALEGLLKSVPIAATDTVVTLGDCLNRGPDSRGVIDLLIGLRESTRLIALLGNHEAMTLQACSSKKAFDAWLECGGDATMLSYDIRSLEDFPGDHWDFINSCHRFYETREFIFAHANLDPSLRMEDQSDGDLFWKHLEHAPWHLSGKVLICGHTPRRTGFPLNLGRAICIDSDVHRTGWLTCIEPQSRRFWQANDHGGTRGGFLEEPPADTRWS